MDDRDSRAMLFAVGKHLAPFQHDHVMTHFYATRRSSQEGDLLIRLRSLDVVSHDRVQAFARDAGIPSQELPAILNGLSQSGLLEVVTDARGTLIEVRERIFTEQAVFRTIASRFENYNPEPVERAVIPLLDLLSRLPLSDAEAIARIVREGFDEETVRRALQLQEGFKLLRRRHVSDLGLTLVYNDYLWGHKIPSLERVLAGLRERETDYLLALSEEVRGVQGRAVSSLTAAPPHLVDMAVHTGFVGHSNHRDAFQSRDDLHVQPPVPWPTSRCCCRARCLGYC